MKVSITEDYIKISDANNNELIYWDRDEWNLDPSITPVIAEAIVMALTNPIRFSKTIKEIQ